MKKQTFNKIVNDMLLQIKPVKLRKQIASEVLTYVADLEQKLAISNKALELVFRSEAYDSEYVCNERKPIYDCPDNDWCEYGKCSSDNCSDEKWLKCNLEFFKKQAEAELKGEKE